VLVAICARPVPRCGNDIRTHHHSGDLAEDSGQTLDR
jgi:hypothetical protein